MQLRVNDVTVNNIPRFLTDKPTPLTHTLVIPTHDFDDPYVVSMLYMVWLHCSQQASQPLRNTNPCLILYLQVRSPLTTHTMICWHGTKKP